MLARFVCVLACVVLAHCLPTKQPTPEELSGQITVISSNLREDDYEDLLKELEKEDATSTTEKVDVEENPATKEETLDDVTVTEDEQSEKDDAKDDREKVADETQNSRVKRDVKDRTDIETIVTVKNNELGTEKKYYFKTISRKVKDEIYKCKIGVNSGDVIFYYRCLLTGNEITGEELQETGQGDFFDIA